MNLQLRHLRLRATTTAGPYGVDIRFGLGLNVIWADNTKGKSTCMQAMLYALGMERMLSPHREIPLPHAMTSFLRNDDETRQEVLESRVSLEVQNGQGEIITIHRQIKSSTDNRLISVDFGSTLTDENLKAPRRDFFVLDPGAALREDGFHYFLEHFLGWTLPTVRRYDSPDAKLYVETIFPLFWVEQKAGWSAIPAAIPTYLKIRDVHKRAVEFILNLDVHRLELRRQKINDSILENARDWRGLLEEVNRFIKRSGGKIEALAQSPTTLVEELTRGHVLISEQGDWRPLSERLVALRGRIASLTATPVPEVGATADQLTRQLRDLQEAAEKASAARIEIYRDRQLKAADIDSLKRRIKSLAEDMQKNQDVQKLQRYSGSFAYLTPDRCPTCEQSLSDTLLSQDVSAAVMPIEDNIEYLRSQVKMFGNILAREETAFSDLEQAGILADRELAEFYSRIRTLRSDLVSSSGSPSAVVIEERVRAEARIRELESIQSMFEDSLERLTSLSNVYANLIAERNTLPADKISPSDRVKLNRLTDLLQMQSREYGFTTFDPHELSISDETYRPQKEGFEIGFETSASDAIRLKWAYQLSLLEIDHEYRTNHPGILAFDEPRQQSSSKVSFRRLLERASLSLQRNQQVIFSTSEDIENLKQILADIDCEEKIFPGYVIQPVKH